MWTLSSRPKQKIDFFKIEQCTNFSLVPILVFFPGPSRQFHIIAQSVHHFSKRNSYESTKILYCKFFSVCTILIVGEFWKKLHKSLSVISKGGQANFFLSPQVTNPQILGLISFATLHISLVCQSANRKSANFYDLSANNKSANFYKILHNSVLKQILNLPF